MFLNDTFAVLLKDASCTVFGELLLFYYHEIHDFRSEFSCSSEAINYDRCKICTMQKHDGGEKQYSTNMVLISFFIQVETNNKEIDAFNIRSLLKLVITCFIQWQFFSCLSS